MALQLYHLPEVGTVSGDTVVYDEETDPNRNYWYRIKLKTGSLTTVAFQYPKTELISHNEGILNQIQTEKDNKKLMRRQVLRNNADIYEEYKTLEYQFNAMHIKQQGLTDENSKLKSEIAALKLEVVALTDANTNDWR